MRFDNHVSIVNDWTLLPPVIPVGHSYISGATGVSAPMIPFFETPLMMLYPPGYATGKNKFTSTVYHKGLWIALQSHDLGPAIVQIPSSPDDIMWPFHTLLSSRKAKFYAAEVKANGKGIAACTMIDVGIVPTPMVPCSVIPLPIVGNLSALMNGVIVGMSPWNMAACWAEVIISIILSLITLGAKTPGAGSSNPDVGSIIAQGRLDNFIQGQLALSMADGNGFIAAGVGFCIRYLGQERGEFFGDAAIEHNFIDGPGTAQLGATRDGETHAWTGSGELGAGHALGPGVTTGGQVSGLGTDAPNEWQGHSGGTLAPGTGGQVQYGSNPPSTLQQGGDGGPGVWGHTDSPFGSADHNLGDSGSNQPGFNALPEL